MFKFLFMLVACSALFADKMEDRLFEIKDIYEIALAETEKKFCPCKLDLNNDALDFAYLLGKKQCIDDIIKEYKSFKQNQE